VTAAPEARLPYAVAAGDNRKILRGFVLVLTLGQTALFLFLVYLTLEETGGWRIMRGVAAAAAVPYFLGVLPALVLAVMNRLLWAALGLSVGVVVLVAGLWSRL
jgi:hypothetical protein